MRRFSGFHHLILVMFYQNKVFKLCKVYGIGCILLSLFIVNLGDEQALFNIGFEMQRIMPILGLNQEILHKFNISSIIEQISYNVTKEDHFSWTVWKTKDSLMLSPKCDKVLHWRLGTSLGNSSEELSSLLVSLKNPDSTSTIKFPPIMILWV